MKKSGLLLLGGIGFIFLILLSLTIYFRVKVDDFLSLSKSPQSTITASGITETREFNHSDFDKLYFEDMWDVVIRKGDRFSITIEADSALFEELELDKRGRELHFSYDRYLRNASRSGSDVRATIIMPDLEKIEFKGMGEVQIENFDLDNLDLINSGASNIDARNVRIDKLDLVVNGAANAELFDIEIKNCHLDISGAAKIQLNMTGGELTGQVSGAASVVYKGSVSDERVSISGIGSLEKH